jgi:hypothetical protein
MFGLLGTTTVQCCAPGWHNIASTVHSVGPRWCSVLRQHKFGFITCPFLLGGDVSIWKLGKGIRSCSGSIFSCGVQKQVIKIEDAQGSAETPRDVDIIIFSLHFYTLVLADP